MTEARPVAATWVGAAVVAAGALIALAVPAKKRETAGGLALGAA